MNSVPEPTPVKSKFCHHCGQMNHKASKCQFKEAICHICGNKGHLKKVCQSGRQSHGEQRQQQRQQAGTRTTWIKVEQEVSNTTDNSLEIFTIVRNSASTTVVELYIDKKPLMMEVIVATTRRLVNSLAKEWHNVSR